MKKLNFKRIYIKEHIENKMSYSQIQKKYNIPRGTWDYYVRYKLGLSCDKRKTKVNDNYFNVIDTEEKAYILGFLYADGYLASDGRIGIRLNRKDKEIIYLIQKIICPDRKVEYTNNQNIKRSPQISLRFKSKKIYSRLEELGFCVEKTKTSSNIFHNIPNQHKTDFIRGFTDGDGSVRYDKAKDSDYYKISLSYCSGTDKILRDIDSYLTKGKGTFYNKGSWWVLSYEKKDLVFKTVKQVYPVGITCYLKRKFNKAIKIKNLCDNIELTN